MTVVAKTSIKRYLWLESDRTPVDGRPALAAKDAGSYGYETDTGLEYIWTGAAWAQFAPTKYFNNVNLLDDKLLTLGTDGDQVLLNRSTVLNADTALANVLTGTVEAQALAANSLIIANKTSNGDIGIYVSKAGSSQQAFWADGSSGDTAVMAASGASVDHYIAGTKVLDHTSGAFAFQENVAISSTGTLTITTPIIASLYQASGGGLISVPASVGADTVCLIGATQELDNKTIDAAVAKGTWTASSWTIGAVTLGGAVAGGDQTWTNVGDVTFAAGSIIASGSTNGNTLLLKANDTTFITLTTGATDTMEIGAFTLSGTISGGGQTLSNLGTVYIGDTANANMTTGLTINQGAADNAILALKSSDVAHGTVDQAETDTFGSFAKAEAATGGLSILGFKAVSAADCVAYSAGGFTKTAADTTKSTAGRSINEVLASQASGSSLANVGADGNVFGIRARVGGAFSTVFLVDEDGDLWLNGGITARALSNTTGALTITPNTDLTVNVAAAKLGIYNNTAPTLDNDTHAGEVLFLRSGGTAGENNLQAVLAFGKADGASLRSGAAISSVQTGSDADNIGLTFITSSGSASAQTMEEKMRLTHVGNLAFQQAATISTTAGALTLAPTTTIQLTPLTGQAVNIGTSTSFKRFYAEVTLATDNAETDVGLTPAAVILSAAIRVSVEITGLDDAEHHIQLGINGNASKYIDVTQGASATTISVNKKGKYTFDPTTDTEAAALKLTITGGADQIPTAGKVYVEVIYLDSSNLADV